MIQTNPLSYQTSRHSLVVGSQAIPGKFKGRSAVAVILQSHMEGEFSNFFVV